MKSIVDYLLEHEKNRSHTVYLKQPRKDGWHEYTWMQVMDMSRRVAAFLYSKGLKKGDHVSIYSKNCAEWFITDFGITLAGMVNVPLFPNQHEESLHYVLKHAEVKLIFSGKLDNYRKAFKALPQDIPIVNFNYHNGIESQYQWSEVLEIEPINDVNMPLPDDLYTIIYSSGTSGMPKGAMYTHQAISNYLDLFSQDIKRFSNKKHHRLISYLPLAHVYERSAIEIGSLAISADVSFVQSLDLFVDNLKHIKPTVFAAVPRIWGVFQSRIEKKISAGAISKLIKLPFISTLIKNKIKKELGLFDCDLNVSGAGHLPESIYHFFDSINIPLQEGYGQTENLAYATLSTLKGRKASMVGSPRLQVQIKRDDKQQLLIKSPCLMAGFFKNAEKTAEAFDEHGWLRTGDLAEVDKQQRVKIIGRISETFKNQKGEFVTPGPIEQQFEECDLVEQLCLVGKGLPSNIMLVNLSDKGRQCSDDDVTQTFIQLAKAINANLKSYEKIGHVLIIEDRWTTENGLLTPTMKVKRHQIEAKYQEQLNKASEQKGRVIYSDRL